MAIIKPDSERFDNFMRVYARCLAVCVAKMPDSYGYPVTEVPSVVQRIRGALTTGSFNHDSPAFRESCKDLGIKFTRSSILGYIQGEEPQLVEKAKNLDVDRGGLVESQRPRPFPAKPGKVHEINNDLPPVTAPVTIEGPLQLAADEHGSLAEADLNALLGDGEGE